MNFYQELKEKKNNFFETNHHNFLKLDEESVNLLFFDIDIKEKQKTFLAENYSEKICSLTFKTFINVVFWVENPKILIEKYGKKINQMTEEEFTEFIKEGIGEANCLLRIAKTSIFDYYKEKEQQEKNPPILQCVNFQIDMYLAENDIEKLKKIGLDILKLIEQQEILGEESKNICDLYMIHLMNHVKTSTIEQELLQISFSIMDSYMKNNFLSPTMARYYTWVHQKEFGLKEKNIYISMQEKEQGLGTSSKREVKICYETIKEMLDQTSKEEEQYKIENFNLNLLLTILHELTHEKKRNQANQIEKNTTLKERREKLKSCKEYNYWFKNSVLQFLFQKEYKESWESFIEETQANIFAILNAIEQINKYFKQSFSIKFLEHANKNLAEVLLSYYIKEENGKMLYISPVENFENWMSPKIKLIEELMKKELSKDYTELFELLRIKPQEELGIKEKLLLGENIPIELLLEFQKILTGEKCTTNLNACIEEVINRLNEQPNRSV